MQESLQIRVTHTLDCDVIIQTSSGLKEAYLLASEKPMVVLMQV